MGILNELKQNNDSAAYYLGLLFKEKEKMVDLLITRIS